MRVPNPRQSLTNSNVSQSRCNHTPNIFRLTVLGLKRSREGAGLLAFAQVREHLGSDTIFLNHLLSGNMDKKVARQSGPVAKH